MRLSSITISALIAMGAVLYENSGSEKKSFQGH